MASGFAKIVGMSPLCLRIGASSRSLTMSAPLRAASGGSNALMIKGKDGKMQTYQEWIEEEARLTALPPLQPSGEVTIHEHPDRDLVNFPRLVQPLYGGRVRLGFVPEEWFDFFYKKTGITGPYVFGVGLITTLLSKELWVVEHEFPIIIPMSILLYLAITKLGPGLAAYLDKNIDEEEEEMIRVQEDSILSLQADIKEEETAQWMAKGQNVLFEAKRENVRLQLEAEFRRRQMEIYKDVKKRLDYQIEVQNARRSVEQRHMVNWIVGNVLKSLDEKQEKRNIDQCIANLKKIAPA